MSEMERLFKLIEAPACGGAGQGGSRQYKWDLRYLRLAREVSTWSKDPSTRVGAVIVDGNNHVVSVGYNGFARGVHDHPGRYADRDQKLRRVIHGEINAILAAKRPLDGFSLYTYPFMPCAPCSGPVIEAGIARVIAPVTPPDKAARWGDDMALATSQFAEAGVSLVLIEGLE